VAERSRNAILYEPRAQHLFVADGASNEHQRARSVDPPSPHQHRAAGTARVHGHGRRGNRIRQHRTEAGKLVAIDAKSLKIKATWPLPGCANPSGLALDARTIACFSVCEGQVMTVTESQCPHTT